MSEFPEYIFLGEYSINIDSKEKCNCHKVLRCRKTLHLFGPQFCQLSNGNSTTWPSSLISQRPKKSMFPGFESQNVLVTQERAIP